jgi:urease accessory protein
MDNTGTGAVGRSAAALLMLADGRFPGGGYAHSGGLEPLVRAGLVDDLASLERFVRGRLNTVAVVNATFAAAACRAAIQDDADALGVLQEELDARTPSGAQRSMSRQLGRQMDRVMSAIAPHRLLDALGPAPHQAVVLGVSCAVLGLGPHDAALACLHESAASAIGASVRLLSLSPFDTHALLARLGPALDELAACAVERSVEPPGDLPAAATPLLDLYAEAHLASAGRLFAS